MHLSHLSGYAAVDSLRFDLNRTANNTAMDSITSQLLLANSIETGNGGQISYQI